MFNKKELTELKEKITEKLEGFSSTFNQRMLEQESSLEKLSSTINGLNQSNQEVIEKVKTELNAISNLKDNFESVLNKLNSINKTIELTATSEIKEVAEKEINSIKDSAKKFREVEEDLSKVLLNINDTNMEISKFIDISNQIKLVDFTLKQHKDDLTNNEREKIRLMEENERLKSLMGKMKRNKY